MDYSNLSSSEAAERVAAYVSALPEGYEADETLPNGVSLSRNGLRPSVFVPFEVAPEGVAAYVEEARNEPPAEFFGPSEPPAPEAFDRSGEPYPGFYED